MVVAGALVATVAGCALVGVFSSGGGLAFSHKLHVLDEGIDCADCHTVSDSQDLPGMPSLASCMLCHENIDADKPPERRVASLFDEYGYRAAGVSRQAEEIIFSHAAHTQRQQDCAACHSGIEASERVTAAMAIRMRDCTTCHTEQGAANDCATCHRDLREDVPPANHAYHWLRMHGKIARAHGEATAEQCSLCHQESTCRDCHLSVPPENHSNYFRLRGHGLHARVDRESCAACHRSDSCDSCHRDTRPISHTGLWGGTQSNHCVSCHFPLSTSNGCATCHRSAPSHALATPMPSWHVAGMNCRQCHGVGIPLPHVDKGDDCRTCHR